MKYFIISQPKAGTYFCANLLLTMNLSFKGLHYKENLVNKYDLSDIKNKKPTKKIKEPIPQSLRFIKEKSFGVGHLAANEELAQHLHNYKKILILRPQEEVIQSWERWSKISGRRAYRDDVHTTEKRQLIENWKYEDNVFVLNFSDMKNENIEQLDKLQIFLFNKKKYDSLQCIQKAKSMKSLTKV